MPQTQSQAEKEAAARKAAEEQAAKEQAAAQAALAARGISFHGWPEQYANVPGGYVVTDGSLQPGDILIYKYTNGTNGGAHYDHVGLYVGGGKAIHGGWTGGVVALAGTLPNRLTMVVRIP